MICPKCGTENSNDSCWCGKCGNKLTLQEQQTEEAFPPVETQVNQNNATKTKRSGMIRFIIAVVALIVIVIYYVYQSTLGGNGEVLPSSSLPFLLCILLFVGTVIGLIIDLVRWKKRKIKIFFSISAVILSIMVLCSYPILGNWSYAQYSDRLARWQANQLSYEEREAVNAMEFVKGQYLENVEFREISYCYMEDDVYSYVTENSDVDSPLKILAKYDTDSQKGILAIVVHRKTGYSFQLRSDTDGELITSMSYSSHIKDSVALDVSKLEALN